MGLNRRWDTVGQTPANHWWLVFIWLVFGAIGVAATVGLIGILVAIKDAL